MNYDRMPIEVESPEEIGQATIQLAAKGRIMITNSVIDEQIALHILQHQESRRAEAHQHIRTNFGIIRQFFAQTPYLNWVMPTAGVVCFPQSKASYSISTDAFHQSMYSKYHTLVGSAHWFEKYTCASTLATPLLMS